MVIFFVEIPRKTVRHYNSPGQAHFLTFSCHGNIPLLNRNRTANWFIEAIIRAKARYDFALWAYVIMPDHVHLVVFSLSCSSDIPGFLKSIKQSTSRKAKIYLKENNVDWLNKLTVRRGNKTVFRFWQSGPGYDRNITSDEELFEKIEYIHNNPVKRGLVSTATEWKWSSACWYRGDKEVLLPVDDIGLPAFPRTNKFVHATQYQLNPH